MTILKVLYYPDTRLRLKAEPVERIDAEVKQLVKDMFETMYEFDGGGLAAIQINVQKRIFIMDASADGHEKRVFINPEILECSGEMHSEEGCLSVPGVSAEVKRCHHVKVRAMDLEGKIFEIEADGGYLAACMQHEIDHLDGKLYIDHLSQIKRDRLIKKMKKIMKRM